MAAPGEVCGRGGSAAPASPAPPSPSQGCSEPRLRDTPEDICFEATANAIALHPARPLLAAGDVDGDVYL